jgi:hypothetical protein
MLYATSDSKPLEFSDAVFLSLDKKDWDNAWEQYAKENGIELPETSQAKAEVAVKQAKAEVADVVVKEEEESTEDAPEGLAGKFSGAAWKNVHMKLEIVGGTRKKRWRLQIKHSDDSNFESYELKDVGFINLRKNEIKQSFHTLRLFAENGGFLHRDNVADMKWKTFKVHTSRLRDDLQAAFGISEDPIKQSKTDGTYNVHFGSLKLTDTPLKQPMIDFVDDGRDTRPVSGEAEIVFYTYKFDQISDMSQTDVGLSSEEREQIYRLDADPDVDEKPLWTESDDEQSDY